MKSLLNWIISAFTVGVCISLALLVSQMDIGVESNLSITIKAAIVVLLAFFAVISVRDTLGEEPKETTDKKG